MGVVAPIVNGEIQDTSASSNSLSNSKTGKGGNTLGKDAFLQLLVAQMKYQDPLEPTSNTEYISQYATFSELEQMQNVSNNVNLQRASSLVGKYAYVQVMNKSTGQMFTDKGYIDFVTFENNQAYLSINDELYSIDDLLSVVDTNYMGAFEKAVKFVERINDLPKLGNITLGNETEIMELKEIYENMTKYEKEFVASDVVTMLNQYVEKIEELKKAQEN